MGKVGSMTKYDRNINPLRVLMIIVIISMLFCTKIVSSEELKVEMLDKSYAPEILYSEVGDKIIWPKSKGHNVEFIKGGVPEGVGKFKTKYNVDAQFTFEVPGIYAYWCTPHKNMGMIGFVVVGDDKSNIEAIKKIRYSAKSKKIAPDLINSL